MGFRKRVVIKLFKINRIIKVSLIESVSRAVSVGLLELNACFILLTLRRWLSQLAPFSSANVCLYNVHLDNRTV